MKNKGLLPLRRSFAIGIAASLALLIAMTTLWIQMRSYLHGAGHSLALTRRSRHLSVPAPSGWR